MVKRKINGADSNGTMQDDEPPAKVSRKIKSKQEVSGVEIARLLESETLFHSGLFKLQMFEMLKSVTATSNLKNRMHSSCSRVTELLKNIPSGNPLQITDRSWLEKKGIKFPMLEKPSEVKGSFQFVPPKEVLLMGSSSLGLAVKPDIEADLVVVMPKNFFNNKDFLNQRYLRKRALYLARIALFLIKKKPVDSLLFTYHQGNPLKPVLCVTVADKEDPSKKTSLTIHAVPEEGTFKLNRFHLSKNNIRPHWFEGGSESSNTDDVESSLPATSFYNMSVLQDIVAAKNFKHVEKILNDCDGIKEGIVLLKVWLAQRGLNKSFGSFNNVLLTSLVCHLLQQNVLDKKMNCYRVFRTTVAYLAEVSFQSDSLSLCSENDQNKPKFEEFTREFPCVMLDVTGYFNLAYMLSSSVLDRVKEEAALSIKLLELKHVNPFNLLFLTKIPFVRKFDYVFHLTFSAKNVRQIFEKDNSLKLKRMDMGGESTLVLLEHVTMLVRKALDTRLQIVQFELPEIPKWSITEYPYSYKRCNSVMFGISLNPDFAFNILEKGPTADQPEATEFREFWGDKAEMRRFKDGTIHEAVLWTETTTQQNRRVVFQSIIEHVMKRHCNIPNSNLSFCGHQMDDILHLPIENYGTGEEQSLDIMKVFEDVNRSVRNLTSVPLSIHSVQGTHPAFRNTDVFPALPFSAITGFPKTAMKNFISQFVPSMKVICMLENSGKWPEDIDAMHAMKVLFHVKMGKELQKAHKLNVKIHSEFVDVYKDGFVFRLMVANTRELAVLRTVRSETGLLKFKETKESLALEREISFRPLHAQFVHGVQQKHAVFSTCVRLCKRWLASQLLYQYLTEEALELLVVHLFVCPYPFAPPVSPYVGLLRFLHLLYSFSWSTEPLMVNINNEFTENDCSELSKEFTKNRAILPPMCIITPQDKTGTVWTKESPTADSFKRIALLAKSSLVVLETQLKNKETDYTKIFRPSLEHFDVLIHIKKKANVLRQQSVDASSSIKQLPTRFSFPVVDFNPVLRLFTDLQKTFEDEALFFVDPFGGSVIGMVWKSSASLSKDVKALNFGNRYPDVDTEKVQLIVNRSAIISDIKLFGRDIISSVQEK